jgi:hypothetical protein
MNTTMQTSHKNLPLPGIFSFEMRKELFEKRKLEPPPNAGTGGCITSEYRSIETGVSQCRQGD